MRCVSVKNLQLKFKELADNMRISQLSSLPLVYFCPCWFSACVICLKRTPRRSAESTAGQALGMSSGEDHTMYFPSSINGQISYPEDFPSVALQWHDGPGFQIRIYEWWRLMVHREFQTAAHVTSTSPVLCICLDLEFHREHDPFLPITMHPSVRSQNLPISCL